MEINSGTDFAEDAEAEQLQGGKRGHHSQQQQGIAGHIHTAKFHEDCAAGGDERQYEAGRCEAAEQAHGAVEPLQSIFDDQQIQQDSHGAIEAVFGSSADTRAVVCANFGAAGTGMLQQDAEVAVHFAVEFDIGQKFGAHGLEGAAEV